MNSMTSDKLQMTRDKRQETNDKGLVTKCNGEGKRYLGYAIRFMRRGRDKIDNGLFQL
jgi:hypothetical protein